MSRCDKFGSWGMSGTYRVLNLRQPPPQQTLFLVIHTNQLSSFSCVRTHKKKYSLIFTDHSKIFKNGAPILFTRNVVIVDVIVSFPRLSLSICLTRLPSTKKGSTNSSVSCSHQTPTSWTSSVLVRPPCVGFAIMFGSRMLPLSG